MRDLAASLGRFHDFVTTLFHALAVVAVAAIASISFAATMSRYLLAHPIPWAADSVSYLLCIAVFLALPRVTKMGLHVAVDFVASTLGRDFRWWLVLANNVIAGLTLCAVAALVFASLRLAFAANTGTAAAYPIPMWWLLAAVFYGFSSSAAYMLRDAATAKAKAGLLLESDR